MALVSPPLLPLAPGRAWSCLDPGSVFDSQCCLSLLFDRFNSVLDAGTVNRLGDSLLLDGENLADRFGGCVTNFCDPREWAGGPHCTQVSDVLLRADMEDRVYLSVGVHPHFADQFSSDVLAQLERLIRGGSL